MVARTQSFKVTATSTTPSNVNATSWSALRATDADTPRWSAGTSTRSATSAGTMSSQGALASMEPRSPTSQRSSDTLTARKKAHGFAPNRSAASSARRMVTEPTNALSSSIRKSRLTSVDRCQTFDWKCKNWRTTAGSKKAPGASTAASLVTPTANATPSG